MNLRAAISIFGYGTSEGVTKSWDTRGRGQKEEEQQSPEAGGRVAQSYDIAPENLQKVAGLLRQQGFSWAGSTGSMDPAAGISGPEGIQHSGLTYEPFSRMEWNHPDGHKAILEAHMELSRAQKVSQMAYQPAHNTVRLHMTAPKAMHEKFAGQLQPVSWMDSAAAKLRRLKSQAAGGQTDSSSFVGRKYTVQDTRYGHYVSEHDDPGAAETAARARPYSRVISQPRPENSPVVRDMARQRLVKTNPDVDG